MCVVNFNHLARNSVWLSDLVSPVSSSDRDNRQLGEDDGTANSGGHFLGALDSQTNVSLAVSDGDEGLEAGTLTSTGLFLDRHDLQDLILQIGATDEEVDDLALFNGEGEQVDLLQLQDLSIAY